MYEDIFPAVIWSDETKTFTRVKKFNNTCAHNNFLILKIVLPHSIGAERFVDFKEEFEEKSETALGRSNESADSRTHCLGNRYSLFPTRFVCSLRIGVFVAEMLRLVCAQGCTCDLPVGLDI